MDPGRITQGREIQGLRGAARLHVVACASHTGGGERTSRHEVPAGVVVRHAQLRALLLHAALGAADGPLADQAGPGAGEGPCNEAGQRGGPSQNRTSPHARASESQIAGRTRLRLVLLYSRAASREPTPSRFCTPGPHSSESISGGSGANWEKEAARDDAAGSPRRSACASERLGCVHHRGPHARNLGHTRQHASAAPCRRSDPPSSGAAARPTHHWAASRPLPRHAQRCSCSSA